MLAATHPLQVLLMTFSGLVKRAISSPPHLLLILLVLVDPKKGARPEEHGGGLVPLFGGSTGIVHSAGEVHAIGPNGLRPR